MYIFFYISINKKNNDATQAWWCVPVLAVLKKRRQEDTSLRLAYNSSNEGCSLLKTYGASGTVIISLLRLIRLRAPVEVDITALFRLRDKMERLWPLTAPASLLGHKANSKGWLKPGPEPSSVGRTDTVCISPSCPPLPVSHFHAH